MNPVTKRLTSVILLAAGLSLLMPASVSAQRRFGKTPPRYKPMRNDQSGARTAQAQYEDDLFEIPSGGGADVIPEVLDEVVPEYASPDYNTGLDPVPDSIPQGEVPSVDVPMEYDGSSTRVDDSEVYSPLEPIAEDTIGSVVDNGYMMDYNANFSGEAPAPVYSTGTWFNRGDWYTEIGGVFYDRSKTRERTPNGGSQTILNDGAQIFRFSNLVRHNFETGARIMLGKFMGRDAARRDHSVDFTFTGGFDWESDRTIISPAGGIIDTSLTRQDDTDPLAFPFFNADEQTIRYDADFTSLEANYKIRSRPGRDQLAMQPDGKWVRHGVGSRLITMLGGFRYLGFNETVDYTSTRLITAASNAGAGRLLTRTNNDQVGFQLGFDSTEKYDDFNWGVRGKIGGFLNFVDRRSVINNVAIDANDVRTESGLLREDVDEVFSFMADLGIHGAYQLRPNLHFKVAYDFILLTNQSLAPDNLEFVSGFSTLNTGGSVFMHGGSLGFEATW